MDSENITQVPVAQIIAVNNDRTNFPGIDALAGSIKATGLIQPITVTADGNKFRIVAGERRYRAVCHLGWDTIPARIITDGTDRRAMLAENTARIGLSPIDEARAYQTRLDEGDSVDDLAAVTGYSHRRIHARLGLLRLDPKIQSLVDTGQFNIAWAAHLVGASTEVQFRVVKAASETLMNSEMIREMAARLTAAETSEASLFDSDSFLVVDDYKLVTPPASRATRRELLRLVSEMAASTSDPVLRRRATDALCNEPGRQFAMSA